MLFFGGQDEVEAGKDIQLEEVDAGGVCLFGQVVNNASIAESVGLFGSGDPPTIGFGSVGATSNCGIGLVW